MSNHCNPNNVALWHQLCVNLTCFYTFLFACMTSIVLASELKESASLTPRNALFNRIIYEKANGRDRERTTTNRALLIFLDSQEYNASEVGAITGSAALAILQQSCPLLVTKSVIFNMLINKPKPESRKTYGQKFHKKIKSILTENFIIANAYEKSDILILIPKAYLKQLGIDNIGGQKLQIDPFKLGLKINIIVDLESELTTKKSYYKSSLIGSDFIKSLYSVFITNEEYTKNKKNALPQWSVFITGHGGTRTHGTTAGISFESFIKFLDFLNYKITTKFLAQSTCFSAGTTIEDIYGSIKTVKSRMYNFPIMAEGVAETTSLSFGAGLLFNEQLNSYYDNFVKKVTSDLPVPYIDIAININPTAALLVPGKTKEVIADFDWSHAISTIPRIRPANYDYFIPLIRVQEINDWFVMSHSWNKTYDLNDFWKTISDEYFLRLVLIKSSYIPFNINFSEALRIVSGLPGESIHVFEQVQCDAGVIPFLTMFPDIAYSDTKTFIIRKFISDKENYDNIILRYTHDLEYTRGMSERFYTKNGKWYKGSFFNGTLLKNDYMNDYDKDIKELIARYKQEKRAVVAIEQVFERKIIQERLVSLNEQLASLYKTLKE